MQNVHSLNHSLCSIFWAKQDHRFIKNSIIVILGSIFIAIAAQIQIPLQPVPITLQNFAVLLISMALGWRWGTLAVALYLFEGLLGFPVFANHKGSLELFSPTGGYLLAFLPAAFISGWLIERGWGRFTFSTAIAAFLGLSVIFVGGLSVLSLFVGLHQSLQLGLYPFLFSGGLKLMILSIVIPTFWKTR